MEAVLTVQSVKPEAKRLNLFERYLPIWVGLCMVVGVVLGKWAPGAVQTLRNLDFGEGTHINVPIVILIWLMIIPMMMKVDFASVRDVGRKPTGLLITLFVNWVVKPFSMAFLAWLFFRGVFSAWIAPSEADQYIAGAIILAAAPCTAMVFVWSYLTDGDPAYTLVQVAVNDLIMLVLFAPIVGLLIAGTSSLTVPFIVLLYSVILFIVIPLTAWLSYPQLVDPHTWGNMVQQGSSAYVSTNDDHGPPRNTGPDFRLSGRQYYGEICACPLDRRPHHSASLFQRGLSLWTHENMACPILGGCAGRAHWSQQFL